MKHPDDKKSLLNDPALQMYSLLSLAGLGAVMLIQLSKSVLWFDVYFNAFLLIMGLLGIVTRFRSAPILLLLAFAASEFCQRFYYYGSQNVQWSLDPAHLLLCFGFLAYTIGQYRLQALTRHVLPLDPRLREETSSAKGRPTVSGVAKFKRSSRLAGTLEIGLSLLALPACTIVAELIWYNLAQRWQIIGLPEALSRFMLFCWVLIVGVVLISAVLSLWRSGSMTSEQATLYLQDTLWRETRGEQRRLNRWLAWGQIRERNKS